MVRIGAVVAAVGLAAVGGLVRAPKALAQTNPPRVLSFLESMKGTEDDELRWPVAVAAASADEVAVADAFGGRLLRFGRVGVSWRLEDVVELGAAPNDLVWDGQRYVASLRQGRGLAAFEGPDLGRRTLPLPRGVIPGALAASHDGQLLVYDAAGGRVLRLAADGTQAATIDIDGQVTALEAGTAGGFFAAVAAEGVVLHFDASGSEAGRWSLPAYEEIPPWPVGLAAEPGGGLVVVDRHAARLLVLDATGELVGLGSRRGWEPGLLLSPAGVTRLPDGLILVADQGNGRAQLFRRTE